MNAFLEATPQPVASDGAVLHEEQHKRSRMDDFCDSGRVINYELALQASLTINYVQQKKTSIFPPAETANASICNNNCSAHVNKTKGYRG